MRSKFFRPFTTCLWGGLVFILISCQTNNRKEKSALAEGQRMYHVRGCAACHGIRGDGLGDRSTRLNPPPREFRDKKAYKQGNTIPEIAQTLATGVANSPAMPQYPYLSQEERINIAKYVYFLQTNRWLDEDQPTKANPK